MDSDPEDLMAREESPAAGSARRPLWSVVAMALRLLLGGVFIYSGLMKLDDPLLFAQAIEKFKVTDPVDHEHLVKLATFAIPWTELLCGAALVVGMWTRAAALVLALALAGFMVLIWQVLARGEAFECSCFGRLKLLCPTRLSRCNLYQNGVLTGLALVLLAGGAGRWSVDRLIAPRKAGTRGRPPTEGDEPA